MAEPPALRLVDGDGVALVLTGLHVVQEHPVITTRPLAPFYYRHETYCEILVINTSFDAAVMK